MFGSAGNKLDKILAVVVLVLAILFGLSYALRQRFVADVRDETVFVLNEGSAQIIEGDAGTELDIPFEVNLPKVNLVDGGLTIDWSGAGVGIGAATEADGAIVAPQPVVPAGATPEEIAAAQAATEAARAEQVATIKAQVLALTGGAPSFPNLTLDNAATVMGLLQSLTGLGDIEAITWQNTMTSIVNQRAQDALSAGDFQVATDWGRELAQLAPSQAATLEEQINAKLATLFESAVTERRARALSAIVEKRYNKTEIIWWLGDPTITPTIEVIGAGDWIFGLDETWPAWLGGGGGESDDNDEVVVSDGLGHEIRFLYADFGKYIDSAWFTDGVPMYPTISFNPALWQPDQEIQ